MDPKWNLTDHACRVCLGRILTRHDKNGRQHVRCANCGLESSGNHKSLCACGQKTRAGKDAGMRCAINPRQTPENPEEIVVTVGNPIEHRPPVAARGRAGKFSAPSAKVPSGQKNMLFEEDDGDE